MRQPSARGFTVAELIAIVAVVGVLFALGIPTFVSAWRASAVGVYRLWRDGGYAVGALTAGLLADTLGTPVAIAAIGGLTFLSGVVVAVVMYETLGRRA